MLRQAASRTLAATARALSPEPTGRGPTPPGYLPAQQDAVRLRGNGRLIVGTLQVPARPVGQQVPLVIVLHGLMDTHRSPLVAAMSRTLLTHGFATLAFDFNGHGESGGRMVDMTVPRLLQDATAVYDHARELDFVSTIGVLGHSQGGVVAGLLAGHLGAGVTALALLAPAGSIGEAARSGDLLGKRFDPDNLPRSLWLYGYRIGREYLRTAQTLPVFDLSARYTGPVTIIHGDRDTTVPLTAAQRYRDTYPHSEFHVLPGFDHSLFTDISQPATLVTSFFRRELD